MLALIFKHVDDIGHIAPDVVAQVEVVVQRLVLILGDAVGHSVPLIGEHVHRIAAQDTACQRVELGVGGTGNIFHLCAVLILEQRQGNASVLIVHRIDIVIRQPVDGLSLDVRIVLDHIVHQRSVYRNFVIFFVVRFCRRGLRLGIVAAATCCQCAHHGQRHECRQNTC